MNTDNLLSNEYGEPGCLGMGCGPLAFILVGLSIFFLVLVGAGGGVDSTPSVNNSTHELLSRNRMMSENQLFSGNTTELGSRNQMNISSNPQNCWGNGSCPTFNITTTNAIRTEGNGSPAMVGPGGVQMCLDPNTQAWTSSACNGQYGQRGQP